MVFISPACSWPLSVLFRNFPTNSMTQFPEVAPKYYLCWGLHPREPQLWRGSRQVWNSVQLVRFLFIVWHSFILPVFLIFLKSTTTYCTKAFIFLGWMFWGGPAEINKLLHFYRYYANRLISARFTSQTKTSSLIWLPCDIMTIWSPLKCDWKHNM